MRIEDINRFTDEIIRIEGGYTNDPDDAGGETKYGITIATARNYGYLGEMKDLPIQIAREIYAKEYIIDPFFDRIYDLSSVIGGELIDTGINCGVRVAGTFLQRCLNVFNQQGSVYPDILVDGFVGPQTIATLEKYLAYRKTDGIKVMHRALNSLQGARYIELAENKGTQEKYVYGWLLNRVS